MFSKKKDDQNRKGFRFGVQNAKLTASIVPKLHLFIYIVLGLFDPLFQQKKSDTQFEETPPLIELKRDII